jgi:hypothetical protein
MIFIFKKKEIVLDCFTTEPQVYNFNKIARASDYYPEWLKNTKKEYNTGLFKESTIKKCIALIEMYKHGAVMPLWADLLIKVNNKNINWQFADFKSQMTNHSSQQWDNFADENKYNHFKIYSPWHFQTKKDVKFYWTKPFWNFPLKEDIDYQVPTGIIDYKYNHSTHINLFVDTSKDKEIFFNAGTPLIHIIPLSENKLIIKNHLVDKLDHLKFSARYTFQDSYKTKKASSIKNEKKCPFGFSN